MSYYNYLDHEKHGRIWYRITLRNLDCMTWSVEQNLAAGPICELEVPDYFLVDDLGCSLGLTTCGSSPQEAIETLQQQLSLLPNAELYPVPPRKKQPLWKRLWNRHRMKKIRFACDPVIWPDVKDRV